MNSKRRQERDAQRLQKLSTLNPDKYDISPVRLLQDHGFITEIGAVYHRKAGSIITNPLEIMVLRERGAQLEPA